MRVVVADDVMLTREGIVRLLEEAGTLEDEMHQFLSRRPQVGEHGEYPSVRRGVRVEA